MLPKMDPEVAKKALEQFPEFAKTATEIVCYYKELVEKGFDYNDASVKSFYFTCNSIIDTLNEQLKDGNLSFQEKQIIIDKMIELAKMKSDKDTENKQFIVDALKGAGLFALGVEGLIKPHVDAKLNNPDRKTRYQIKQEEKRKNAEPKHKQEMQKIFILLGMLAVLMIVVFMAALEGSMKKERLSRSFFID